MALDFFFDRFDTDNSATINTTEFNAYLTNIRGDHEDHCSSASAIFAAANVTSEEANGAELEAALAISTGCVLDVYCGLDFKIQTTDEEYECSQHIHDHDHDHDDDHDHEDDNDHDHDDHVHDADFYILFGEGEFECHGLGHDHGEEDYSYGVGTWFTVLAVTTGVSLLSLLGALFVFCGIADHTDKTLKLIDAMMALALGVLLQATFGHLTQEALHLLDSFEEFGNWALFGVAVGLGIEFLFPTFAHFCYSPENASKILESEIEVNKENDQIISKGANKDEILSYGATITNICLGDFMHNFVDGFVIALAFTLCGGQGSLPATVTLGSILHELPGEIADFLVLLRCGLSFKKALLFNFMSGLSALLGAFIVLGLGEVDENTQGIMLAFSAGVLAFLTLAEVFPFVKEGMEKRGNTAAIGMMLVIGLCLGLVLGMLPHEHCSAGGHDHDHNH